MLDVKLRQALASPSYNVLLQKLAKDKHSSFYFTAYFDKGNKGYNIHTGVNVKNLLLLH
jgi:hypothetical protein